MNTPRLRILFLTGSQDQASYRYRVEQFLPHWNGFGVKADVFQFVGTHYFRKIALALSSWNYDYVWIQKKTPAGWLVRLMSARTPIIYDFDDAIYTREPYTTGKPRAGRPGSPQVRTRLRKTLRSARMVFAGNSALADYARAYCTRVHIVPTSLDVPQPPASSFIATPVRFGWIGSARNLFYLQCIDQTLAGIQEEYGHSAVFHCMSSTMPENVETRWEFTKWTPQAEKTWLKTIDVGLMPLTDDPWSRGKCAFKLLQCMANGHPVIGSAVGANFDVIENGVNGYLAETEEDWKNAVGDLVTAPGKLRTMGEVSRNIFDKRFSRAHVQKTIAEKIWSDFDSRQQNGKGFYAQKR